MFCNLGINKGSVYVLIPFLITCLSNSGIVAAAVVQISHATIFGKRVHDSGRTDCVDE